MTTNHRIFNSAILAVTLGSCLAPAQTVSPGPGSAPTDAWHADSVVYVAGLDDLKQNARGSLRIMADALVFSSRDTHEEIPLKEITAVSDGDERVATGGTSAKVARKIFIFGFGAAAGAVTSKTVDVLTVEYQDARSGYHGAVFEVPKGQAGIAKQQLTGFADSSRQQAGAPTCSAAAQPKTLLVAPIDQQGLDLPAEYRVLLYEQLVAELRKAYAGGTILRVGEHADGCPAETLHVSVGAFKKGNEKLRASTGPVGLFVGGTSVAFSARLVDQAGTVLFDKNLKNSKHGDSDSLGVARNVAQDVSKRLAKSKTSGFAATV